MIFRSDLVLNDSILSIGHQNDRGFFSKISGDRVLPYKNMFHNALTYEISLTQIVYHRQVYSWIDLLSAVGGII